MTRPSDNRPLLGVLMVVAAMSILGFIDNFIKLIARDAGLWQFHFLRALLISGIVLSAAPFLGWRLRPNNWRPVVLRSFFFSSAMVVYFGAAGIIPIAEAGAGLFSSPIFVLLISAVFLGVRIGVWRVLAVAIGFTGVILILKPNAGDLSLLSFMPLFAGLLYALSAIATRQWCEGESTITLTLGVFMGLGVWGALGLGYLTLFPVGSTGETEVNFFTRGWVSPTPAFLFWLVVQTAGALIALPLLTRGYQLAEVSFVTVFEYTFLISAAFWSYMLWGEILDMRATLGIGAIIVAGVIIAMRSR